MRIFLLCFLLGFSIVGFSQPAITSFTPTSGAIGTLVTINGTNLSNPSSLTIGGSSAIIVSKTSTQLVAMVMPGSVSGTITLTTQNGSSTSVNTFAVSSSNFPSTKQGPYLSGSDMIGPSGYAREEGCSVAISADGNTAIVGALGEDSSRGGAFVYVRSNNVWSQQGGKLVGSGALNFVNSYGMQGFSVSISADGNTAIIGGIGDNHFTGGAWIFTRNGSIWSQQGSKLVGNDATGFGGLQGSSVSMSADGNTVIIGAPGDNSYQGAAYIFMRYGNNWFQQGSKLIGSGSIGAARQGNAVSISSDGNTVIIGGYLDNNKIGASWIFARTGNIWTQQGPKLIANDYSGSTPYQGTSVALNADGKIAVVGNYQDNINVGSANIFTLNGDTWSQLGNKLVASDTIGPARQGSSVSISADGNTIVVGGELDDTTRGASWIFTRNGNTWLEEGNKLTVTIYDTLVHGIRSSDYQGHSVSLSADGTTAIIGGLYSMRGWGLSFIYTLPAPTITSFSPLNATTGDTIIVVGNNFSAVKSVTLGGTAVASSNVLSSTLLTAIVGLGSTGDLNINAAGGTATQAGFTYVPPSPPTITSINPLSGVAGDIITVTGTNFSAVTSVSLGGTAISSFSILSSTVLTVIVGTGSTGSLNITTTGGTASLSGFTYLPPTISSLSPTSGPIGTLVTVNGTNLYKTTAITIGGVNAIIVSNTGTKLIAMVMPGTTNGTAAITTTGGTTTGSNSFTVTATKFPGSKQGSYLSGTGKTGLSPGEGGSVAISADGNAAVVGAPGDGGIGSVYVYVRNGGTWSQQGSKLTVSDFGGGVSEFGYSVAINADGNTIVVGMPSDNNGIGAIWVFKRNGNVWTQQGNKLVGSGSVGNTISQGGSLSISADGNTIVEGGQGDNNAIGAVWVFRFNGTVWVQQGNKLVGTGAVSNAGQGKSVALSADGNTIVEGGSEDNAYVGASWIFSFDGNNWNQQGNKLVGSGYSFQPKQGSAVSISADGNTVIIGGKYDNVSTGAAWIFIRTGSSWSQQGNKLVGSGYIGQPQQGSSVSISGDGNTAVIGGYNDNNPVGGVWVFTRNGNTWEQKIKLVDSTNYTGGHSYVNYFNQGYSVSISTDGTTAIVGAPFALFSGFGGYGLSLIYKITPPPTITSFEPLSAASGASITVTGTDFTGVSSVSLGGTAVGSFTVLSSTTLTAVVASGSSGSLSITTTAGSADLAGFTYLPPSTIISFTPTSAAAGATITVTGTNLSGATAVSLGGTAVASFNVLSSTVLTAVVGSGASGSLSITTTGGITQLGGFTYLQSPPTITSFSPTIASAGTMIVITGTNFSTTTDVSIGGVSAYNLEIFSSTRLTAYVGLGATGAISVTTTGGTANLGGFSYIPNYSIIPANNFSVCTGDSLMKMPFTVMRNTPSRYSITWDSLAIRSHFTNVTNGVLTSDSIQLFHIGSNFLLPAASRTYTAKLTVGDGVYNSGQYNISVTVNPSPSIPDISGPATTCINSSAQFTTTGSGGQWTIVSDPLTNANWLTDDYSKASINASGKVTGVALGKVNVMYRVTSDKGCKNYISAPLTISAAIASPVITGPTNFAINTTGTLSSATSGGVWSSSDPTKATINNAGLVNAIYPGTTGISYTITGTGSCSASGITTVTVLPVPPPSIISFSPTSARTGDTVTLTGSNFTYINSIQIGLYGISWPSSYTIVSPTKIQMVIADGYSGSIRIFDQFGQGTYIDGFTFLGPVSGGLSQPVINSFEPLSAAIGASLTITGSNFSSVSSVTIGGTQASFRVLSSTTVIAVVGNGSSGQVSITTAGGTTALSGFTFITAVTNPAAPVITSFEPLSAAAGASLTVTGINLSGTLAVSLGGTPVASFKVLSSTTLSAIVSSGSTGNLSITTAGGTAALSGFTFIPSATNPLAPVITSFEPLSAVKGAIITVTGTNFTGTSAISLGGTAVASFKVLSSTSLTAIVAAGSTGSLSITTTNGTASLAGFTYISLTPTITSFTPLSAVKGSIITITGTNFTGATLVSLGTTALDSVEIASPTTIRGKVGAGSSGSVTVTTPNGTATLAGFSFIPYAPTITASGPTTFCAGENFVLTSSDSMQSIQWFKDGTLIPGTQGKTYTVSASGIYTLKVGANGLYSALSEPITVTVNPLPITGKPLLAGYSSDTLVCYFTSLVLSSRDSYEKYLWSNGETSASTNIIVDAGTWLRVGNNQTPCYSEKSITVLSKKNLTPRPTITRSGDNLISSSSIAYKWLFNNKLTGDTLDNIKATAKGVYNISTSIDKSCWNTSQDYLILFDPITVKKVFDLTAYPNPTNGVFNLQLKFEKNITAVIKITIADAGGITKLNTKKLLFNDKSIRIPVNLSLAKGIYTIKVDVNGEINTQQLIVQ